jgi:hypothetical protein
MLILGGEAPLYYTPVKFGLTGSPVPLDLSELQLVFIKPLTLGLTSLNLILLLSTSTDLLVLLVPV